MKVLLCVFRSSQTYDYWEQGA